MTILIRIGAMLLGLLVCVSLQAQDEIILSTNEVVSGRIVRNTPGEVTIEVDGKPRTIQKSEIVRIRREDMRQRQRQRMFFGEILIGRGVPTSVAFHQYGNPFLADLGILNLSSPNEARRNLAGQEFMDSTVTPRVRSETLLVRVSYGISNTIELGLVGTQADARISDFRNGLATTQPYVFSTLIRYPEVIRTDVPGTLDYAYFQKRTQIVRMNNSVGIDVKLHPLTGPADPYVALTVFNRGLSAAIGLRYFVYEGTYLSVEGFHENFVGKVPKISVFPLTNPWTPAKRLITNSGWRVGIGNAIDLNL